MYKTELFPEYYYRSDYIKEYYFSCPICNKEYVNIGVFKILDDIHEMKCSNCKTIFDIIKNIDDFVFVIKVKE